MKKYKTETVTGTTEVIVETACDLCGAVKKSMHWGSSSYEMDEVTIMHKKGNAYPECGYGTIYEVDMCPECFENKLIPWLESQGVEVEKKEWDY